MSIQDMMAMLLLKKLNSRVPIKGHLHMELVDPDGNIIDVRDYRNTITVLYDATVADRMAAGSDALVGFTGIGTTSGGKSTASVALEAQVHRKANSSDVQGAGADDNDTIHSASFAAGEGTGAIVEAGLFTDVGGNTLCAWQDFAAVNKGAADTLNTTWTITHGAS